MQCHLNVVHISEVPNFLAESLIVPTHVIELPDPFDAAHLLVCCVTSYFDVYSPSVAESENENILKTHLIAKEPQLDLSTN